MVFNHVALQPIAIAELTAMSAHFDTTNIVRQINTKTSGRPTYVKGTSIVVWERVPLSPRIFLPQIPRSSYRHVVWDAATSFASTTVPRALTCHGVVGLVINSWFNFSSRSSADQREQYDKTLTLKYEFHTGSKFLFISSWTYTIVRRNSRDNVTRVMLQCLLARRRCVANVTKPYSVR